jgi:hypothetical protein
MLKIRKYENIQYFLNENLIIFYSNTKVRKFVCVGGFFVCFLYLYSI